MTNWFTRSTLRWIALAVVLTGSALQVLAVDYIPADAKVTGKEMHTFTDRGENVMLILGKFHLTVGEHRISSRDAVLWVTTDESGPIPRHEITMYIEGDGRVVEPGGATTSDATMLITIRSEGRLSAGGVLSERALSDFPLFKRASMARRHPVRANRRKITRRSAPPLVRAKAPPRGKPAPRPAAVAPGLLERPRSVESLTEAPKEAPIRVAQAPPERAPEAPQKRVPEASPARPPKAPSTRTARPVSFRADKFTHEMIGKRWVTVARGNVYLSQGDPDSDLFMELRSQAAVVFSKKGARAKQDVSSPYSPALPRMGTDGEAITGVYLEGDVLIARGERSFRGPAAFYDFTTDRAIVVEPVFRTLQKQRNIPIYIRASEARALSARETWFTDARISTSEFYTPTYHVGAQRAYVMDNTPYDPEGKRIGERAWNARLKNVTFNVRGVPIFYSPFAQGDLEQGNTALRRVKIGKRGKFGWGVDTEWHLFRLLGLVKPKGFKGRFDLNYGERGVSGGVRLDYARKAFSGYHIFYGVTDVDRDDDFGTERENIDAPPRRGRVLMRHKQFLSKDWQLQFELSYYCDRNFLEQFFPDDFFAGKEQETLLYAKKQTDNWAFTSLLKTQLIRFQNEAESYPDLGLYLLGEPLLGDRLTFFHESHAGIKRYRTDNRPVGERLPQDRFPRDGSGHFVRLDTREQVDFPLRAGPINIVPYAVGRATYWDDDLENTEDEEGKKWRPYGQVGLRANTHIWGVYDNVVSRLWDLRRLRHIITPEVVGWLGSTGVRPENLFPLDPDIERDLRRTSGFAVNLYQRLQTKRREKNVDWMRLNLSLGVYNNGIDGVRSDGRFFGYRPEYSLSRNHFNGEYFWSISDATTLLSDFNYDIDDRRLGRGNIGLAVRRDPRLRYYAGVRYIDDLNSAVGTFGVDYEINRKYSISAFEQYDFAFRDGRNLSTSLTITRKFPRWYTAFTFSYDNSTNEITLMISVWPEGISEARLGTGKLALLPRSDEN